jgi:hypothetical protein
MDDAPRIIDVADERHALRDTKEKQTSSGGESNV